MRSRKRSSHGGAVCIRARCMRAAGACGWSNRPPKGFFLRFFFCNSAIFKQMQAQKIKQEGKKIRFVKSKMHTICLASSILNWNSFDTNCFEKSRMQSLAQKKFLQSFWEWQEREVGEFLFEKAGVRVAVGHDYCCCSMLLDLLSAQLR